MGSSLLLKGGTSTPKSIVETISTASPHGFGVGDVVRYDVATSVWTKSQANSAENSEVAGVVSAVPSNTSFDITYSGYISIGSLAGVTSPVLFLDSTAAGGLTASPPSAIGMVVKPVLTKTTNGSGYIVSNYIGTQIGGSSTVAIDEIQPVGTIMPFAGSAIPDSWLACDGNSYAVSAYPNLYAKLQNSSGDRVPAYGYVVEIGVNTTTYGTWFSTVAVGDTILYSPTQTDLTANPVTTYSLIGRVLAKGTASVTVQIFAKYVQDSGVKNSRFEYPNVIPSTVGWVAAFLPVVNSTIYDNLNSNQRRANGAGQPTAAAVSTVSVTHFNTPDLRGRFAIGTNTSNLGELESDGNNYSAIAGLYPLGSQGGQEVTPAGTGVLGPGSYAYVTPGTNGLVANMPPYTVVRYIIKATPYTRAAIIDGIDIPYTSLLVGDLRDGSLRPGGSGEALVFKTNDGTSGVERMRLTNTATTNAALGSVLIGTTSPTSTYNSNYRLLEIAQTNGSGGSAVVTRGSTITLESGVTENTGAIVGTRSAHPLIFRTNTTERMRIDANGLVNISSTTASTSKTTGGLTLGGGLGVGGAIYAGGLEANTITASDTTASTSTTTGSLIVKGGAGIAGALYVGGGITAARLDVSNGIKLNTGGFNTSTYINITETLASTSTGSGALVVAGGVGIAGALYVGGGITLGTSQLAVPTGNAPIFGARAWGMATIASTTSVSLTSAGNIASVSISGTELTFTFNTATQMPDVNYAVSIMGSSTSGGSFCYKVSSKSTSAFTVSVNKRSDNANAFGSGECQQVYVVVYR